jgi:uncharacterized protein (DUF1684 family)
MRVLPVFLALQLAASSGYEKAVGEWRETREQQLKAQDGWLTLIGLFWLRDGDNEVGSAGSAPVKLPAGFPERAGIIEKQGARLYWRPAAGAPKLLKTDKSGAPDIFQVGRIHMHVIERGTKFGVRMKDSESETRRNFTRLTWFPVREEWRVKARFIEAPKKMLFDAQAGDKQEMISPGYVEWQHGGKKLRLTPVLDQGQLWFVFRDTTAGKSTYPAARFLYADMPEKGFVTLDFNKAYNPPCVFTPWATCPLPPPGNRLPVAVEAGEMMYKHR